MRDGIVRSAFQAAVCGLVVGAVLLVGGRLLGPGVVMAQDKAAAEVVKAKRFEVVDAQGRVRAALGFTEDGKQVLNLSDEAENVRASLRLAPDGSPVLGMRDAAGKAQIMLAMTKEGQMLGMSDGAGNLQAQLFAQSDGQSALILHDQNNPRAILALESDGPSLKLYDKDGKVAWKAP